MNKVFEVGVANAFTNQKYKAVGNPAGFVLVDQLPDATTMSAVASKTGLPMTAFVSPRPSSRSHYDVRYYDHGGRECHICGHATIVSTAHLLHLHEDIQDFSFFLNPDCFSGTQVELKAHSREGNISLDLLAGNLKPCLDDKNLVEKFSKGLNIPATQINGIAFCTNIRDYVVEVKNADILASIKPDFVYLKAMAEQGDYQHEGIMVTAAVTDSSSEFDIHSRAFLPITDVNEDVACGSANCSIIPYWVQKGLIPKKPDGAYYGLFPYPPGGSETCGGVQKIEYRPDKNTVTLTVGATVVKPMTISL